MVLNLSGDGSRSVVVNAEPTKVERAAQRFEEWRTALIKQYLSELWAHEEGIAKYTTDALIRERQRFNGELAVAKIHLQDEVIPHRMRLIASLLLLHFAATENQIEFV